MQKQSKAGKKSEINRQTFDGLIQENIDLSDIYLDRNIDVHLGFQLKITQPKHFYPQCTQNAVLNVLYVFNCFS